MVSIIQKAKLANGRCQRCKKNAPWGMADAIFN